MNLRSFLLFLFVFASRAFAQDTLPALVNTLPLTLHESSSLITAKSGFWTMNDGPAITLYRIDQTTGAILQQVNIINQQTEDTEALTQDDQYIYVGDFGNNHAPRSSWRILKIKKANITNAVTQDITAEVITYSYSDFNSVEFDQSTKSFDCEAVLSYKDNLYLFTKRRLDNKTVLYQLSKQPGKQTATKLDTFNSEGVITDAAINASGTEVALIGYHLPGHKASFIWKLSGFTGNKFFSGKRQLINISGNSLSWQTEGIVYQTNKVLYLSCEQTADTPCGLYKIALK